MRNVLGGINGDLKCRICGDLRHPHTVYCNNCKNRIFWNNVKTISIIAGIILFFILCGCCGGLSILRAF